MEEYLLKQHKQDILRILKTPKGAKTPEVKINLQKLQENDYELFKNIVNQYDIQSKCWVRSLNLAQQKIAEQERSNNMSVKQAEVSFCNHPEENCKLSVNDLWKICGIKGYVYRTSRPIKRMVLNGAKCKKCKKKTILKADRIYDYSFDGNAHCSMSGCDGKMSLDAVRDDEPNLEFTIDVQEVKIQFMDRANIHKYLEIVELENNLVDSCVMGDTVRVCGVYETRSKRNSKNIDRFVLRAVSIMKVDFDLKLFFNPTQTSDLISKWQNSMAKHNYDELAARDEILQAVAPQLYGADLLKLALVLVLCTGGKKQTETVINSQLTKADIKRDISHILFIGESSLGKSELLKAAAAISDHSVQAIGYNSTKAGLVGTHYKKNNKIYIEPGALVRANNGVCCIDEFDLLPRVHRTSIHEIMEHQRITMIRCDVKTELEAKCSIVAGMSSDSVKTDDASYASTYKIEQSLMSRFDFVFFLDNPNNSEYDVRLIDYICSSIVDEACQEGEWNLERLQLHLAYVKNIQVEVTKEVKIIINQYHQFCSHCDYIDASRKTVRLYESLGRLTVAHAKLLMRNRTKIIDVISIIVLFEQSWTFGYLMEQFNVLTMGPPLGPPSAFVKYVLDFLHVGYLYECYEKEETMIKTENEVHAWNTEEMEQAILDNTFTQSAKDIDTKILLKDFKLSSFEDIFEGYDKEELSFIPKCESTQIVALEEEKKSTCDFIKPTCSPNHFQQDYPECKENESNKRIKLQKNSIPENDYRANLSSIASFFSKTPLDTSTLPATNIANPVSAHTSSSNVDKPKLSNLAEKLKKFEHVSQEAPKTSRNKSRSYKNLTEEEKLKALEEFDIFS